MKPEEVETNQTTPEYRVDDPQAAWAEFEALAKKRLTTPNKKITHSDQTVKTSCKDS